VTDQFDRATSLPQPPRNLIEHAIDNGADWLGRFA
jgi:hypothetical protein